eukprot:15477428-Alexandrium_andersonii.AAC.1
MADVSSWPFVQRRRAWQWACLHAKHTDGAVAQTNEDTGPHALILSSPVWQIARSLPAASKGAVLPSVGVHLEMVAGLGQFYLPLEMAVAAV